MRFPISFNTPSKIILGIMGAGPSRSWAEVQPDAIHIQMGWAGNATIPLTSITSVEHVSHTPWWMGLGVHGFFGTWIFNGAMSNAVKITINDGASGRVLFFPVRPHTVYVSLESPDEFVHEVKRG